MVALAIQKQLSALHSDVLTLHYDTLRKAAIKNRSIQRNRLSNILQMNLLQHTNAAATLLQFPRKTNLNDKQIVADKVFLILILLFFFLILFVGAVLLYFIS